MSRTTTTAAPRREVARGAGVGEPPLLLPRQQLGGARRSTSAAGTRNSSPLTASRTADVATSRARSTPAASMSER